MARRISQNRLRGIRGEMSSARTAAGTRPWRATHGWRTAPPGVQGGIDRIMGRMKQIPSGVGTGPTNPISPGGWKRGRGLAQNVLRAKYGTGFSG